MHPHPVRTFAATLALLSAALVALPAGCQGIGPWRGGGAAGPPAAVRKRPLPTPNPIRAVWVARFHYRYPEDVRSILRNCSELGFNTVLWQVRGNATVAYRSDIEPWSEEFDFQDPGYDPLALAVQEAHRRGLRIEAWVNVMPGWKGRNPPPVPNQVYHTHPDWFLHDEQGNRQPAGEFYQILNPCLPAVRRYITRIMEEIVGRYDVDGLHLDYVRYAWETTPNARKLYPRDPVTLNIYRQQTGKHPDDDPRAWDDWRANQLSRLVADIREAVRGVRPGATLTAAVWSDPNRGYRDYFQNSVGWVRGLLVDALYPMAYTADLARFDGYLATYRSLAPNARVVPGVGAYLHSVPEQLAGQLERCRLAGGEFAIFSYDSLFATAGDRGLKPAELAAKNAERAMRRRLVAAAVQP